MRVWHAVPVIVALLMTAAAPAGATASVDRCSGARYCMFSGPSFTGTRVFVGGREAEDIGVRTCYTVAAKGIEVARSIGVGEFDYIMLDVYADSACQELVGTPNDDIPDTVVGSYRLTVAP
ncbi:hypothetical protein [Streptoalloteichus hindustanus]|uniref:Peptidase inhibitor family I36 n=1 Tax=Streptoalloteichus hindustanus TaxID=2017 RepID=A0A1M5HZD2_STRHI|nr:hypothetical protein [Streptoalloteichus hindustanus]SHG21232.1 hypothetical protein SAMN05444320_10722 [Streptoalloteichus hindustanus]